MTWTRLNDGWTDSPELSDLSLAARWHYLSMIQWCSKNALYDGVVRLVDARRCSDIEDPMGALSELTVARLLSNDGRSFRVVHIDQHIPPEYLRSQELLARLSRMNADQQANQGPNKLEQAGYEILNGLGVPYERQVMFRGKFTPDATIPSAKLIVQFDGEYWHDRAGTNTDPARVRQVQRDRAQDAYIRACGWEVIRLWETDVHRNPQGCSANICEQLALRSARADVV